MTSFLAGLPHQFPFRAASAATVVDEKTIEGTFVVTAGDALAEGEPPATMLVEAMAQIAGSLVFTTPGEHGFLSAIDEYSLNDAIGAGDSIALRVTHDASFGRIFRFSGVAYREGLEFARAKFYLASPEPE